MLFAPTECRNFIYDSQLFVLTRWRRFWLLHNSQGDPVNLGWTDISNFIEFLATFIPPRWRLLTYPMVQSSSWEANWFAASQEIPRISRNLKVHYCTHKGPPPVSILGQPNPVHIPTSHLLEIHPNIIHPSTSRSPQWSLSLRFPHQDPIHLISSPIRATCPAHLILLDFITRTILGEEPRWRSCYIIQLSCEIVRKVKKSSRRICVWLNRL